MILIIILVVILILMFMNKQQFVNIENINKEHFATKIENTNIKLEPVKTKIDLVEDPLFKDVVVYENDEIDYMAGTGTIGLEKCYKACKGTCVEWGMTGVAYCYPKDDKLAKKAYTDFILKSVQEEKK